MERYNLSAEHIVKLLYRKKINRVTTTDTGNFFNSTVFAKVFGNNFSNNNYKISWEEINRTEIRLKANFPRILRRYYHECGDLEINSCFSSILNLDEIGFSHTWEREALEDDGVSNDEIEKALEQTDNFLIFWTENQGVWNAGIKKEDLSLENPPVYMTNNDDLYSWEKVTDDIDTFIILQVLDNLQSSGFYFLTFDSEEIDFLLLDKKISKDELLKNSFKIKKRNLKFPTYSIYDYKGDKIYIFQMKDDKFEKCLLIKPSVKKDETSYADEILLKIARILSFNDREILKKLELILEDFNSYLRNDINFRYIDDEINALSDKGKIKLKKIELKIVAMILILSENGYICYLDWKCELEDFRMISDVMKKVGIDKNLCNIEDLNLDEGDDIEIWSEKFNKVFSKKDIFIGNIDTSSDSYSIFPINRKNLEKLKELGTRINMKIDFLNYSKEDKNMWQEMYERNKEKFRCKIDLESYFNEKKIGIMEVDTLDIGEVNLPTGEILACDPLVEFGEAKTYIQKTPVGKFPVKIAVVLSEDYGDRYACVKVEFKKNKPVVYELAVTGNEEGMDEAKEDEYYGFGVDAGMGCVADKKAQEEYSKYWKKLEEEEGADNPYDDIFEELLEESFKKSPKYQRDCGDWANFIIPNSDLNIPVFASGWGDGYYPCYFGYGEKGELCGFYIHFIDIEKEFSDDE
ncbi:MAG: DUF6630 family protein [Fusobacterium sp.]|uniref:DUF6630 family protein n=1 Tax=Fusobacterium sp. TaxID=68766 RepID=UPI003993F786